MHHVKTLRPEKLGVKYRKLAPKMKAARVNYLHMYLRAAEGVWFVSALNRLLNAACIIALFRPKEEG